MTEPQRWLLTESQILSVAAASQIAAEAQAEVQRRVSVALREQCIGRGIDPEHVKGKLIGVEGKPVLEVTLPETPLPVPGSGEEGERQDVTT